MRFAYAYKTADGIRHEDAIDSPSRDEAFAALRLKGIRPIKVVEVRRAKPKLAAVLPVLAALAVAIAFLAVARKAPPPAERPPARLDASESGLVAKPRARKQLPEELFSAAALERTFVHPAERALARYARPGVEVAPPGADESAAAADDFADALDEDIPLLPDDSSDVVELKRIVAGIKLEAKMLVASGRTFPEVIAYFAAQQAMEAEYRRKVLESSGSEEEKVRQLSALGLN